MSKAKKELLIGTSAQCSLFESPIVEGALDVSLAFRDALSKALSRCKLSRWQVAAMMSELTRRNISKDMLDKYTSHNLDFGLRAEVLPALLYIVQSLDPARTLLSPVGGEVIDPGESKYVKLARLEQENQRLQNEMSKLRHELGIHK